ncbi:MAG: DUF4350 domain-containing protein, partial [Methanolinea sp.]|nr:DUF4350 domain-containing protein [Methanolinea sp.]
RVLWVAGLLLLIAFLATTLHLSGSNLAYSRYNTEWNGTSLLFQDLDSRNVVFYQGGALPPGGDSLFLILVPEGEYSETESEGIRDFLVRGNIVVLADDRRGSDPLISRISGGIRIVEGNLSSADRYYDDPSSLMAFPQTNDTLTEGIPRILLNRPSYLEGGTPVFSTSLLSWVDENGDGRLSSGEPLGRYPVVASERIGNGSLYVISDPSIFINSMQTAGKGENEQFVLNVLSFRPNLVIDQVHSRTGSATPVIRVVNFIKDSIPIKMALVILMVLGIILLFRKGGDGS